MSKITIMCSLSVFLFTACSYFNDSQAVVTFNGGEVTQGDLQKEGKQQLYEARKQLHRTKRSIAEQMAAQRVLKLEAEKKGVSVEKLLAQQRPGGMSGPSEQQVRDYYERNKGRINKSYTEVKDRIAQFLKQQTERSVRRNYVQKLKEKYNVKVHLKEPQVPRVEITNLANDPQTGPKNAPVKIVEFSEYQCPYCRRLQPTAQRIREEFGDQVNWVFKDFPLQQHKQAIPAAIAANCAGKQDKYFSYQKRLFGISRTNAGRLPLNREKFIALAKDTGLNMSTFKECLVNKDDKMQAEIEADIEQGKELGVGGTPTVFVNGRKLSGQEWSSFRQFKKVIEEELKSS